MKASRLNNVRPMFTCRHDGRGDAAHDDGKKERRGVFLLTYRGSPFRAPFTRAKQGYWSTEKMADRARIIPYSFPKWHDGKLQAHREESDGNPQNKINQSELIQPLYIHLSLVQGPDKTNPD